MKVPEKKINQNITSSSQFEKVTIQGSITELWTIIFNQMTSYQLMRLDQT